MIAFIEGILELAGDDSIVISAGGIGYEMLIPLSDMENLPSQGSEIKLYTYMSVREDGISLFGFSSRAELSMFKKLITVSGVGPKAALSILSVLDSSGLMMAILAEDSGAISKAPGIGPKTAKKVILELKDKIDPQALTGSLADSGSGSSSALFTSAAADVMEALISLGYSRTDAAAAIRGLDAEGLSSEELLKEALRRL